MRSRILRWSGFTMLAVFGAWAVILLGPTVEARVEARSDDVVVLPRSGMWFHRYTVVARPVNAAAGRSIAETDAGASTEPLFDALSQPSAAPSLQQGIPIRVTEMQHDTLRTGMKVRIHQLPVFSSIRWFVDDSVLLGLVRALGARIADLRLPTSAEPSLGSMSGLARVVSVHRVNARPNGVLLRRGDGTAGQLDLIVVEFWAQRLRSLVRTVDVVDARSIDDLGPGQVLQMHYEARTPRRMRLDDGMRTHMD